MSTAAERIKEAAARDEAAAEAGLPDEDEQEQEATESEPAPEPEPEPAPALEAGGMTAEQGQELERATTAYYKRVAKVFGGELPPECPACAGLGFDLTGGATGLADFQEDDTFRMCPNCTGLGQVLTGSKAPGQETIACPKCDGRGYQVRLAQSAASVVAVENGEPDAEFGVPQWAGDPNIRPSFPTG